jgi:hypothetical protein
MGRKMSGSEAHMLRILRTRAAQEQGGLCYWCKEVMELEGDGPRRLTGDHLKPMHRGGKTVPGNIVAACKECNGGRHPELNSMGGGVVVRSGIETHKSPFEVLALDYPSKMAREFKKMFCK